MAKKWYNHEMFVVVEKGNPVMFHLNKKVVDVTNDTHYHRIPFPLDKWKYDDMRIPKSVKEIGPVTYASSVDSVKAYNGFFIAFEISDGINASDEAHRIYNWLLNHRKFW